MKLYWRVHEIGNHPRIRVWTDAMLEVGQFEVVEFNEFETFRFMASKFGIQLIEVDDDDDDDDDVIEE